jgi:GTP diphosphokinase / guanosine-3',5'-bis(diphosphate) 3'-diphosphatase
MATTLNELVALIRAYHPEPDTALVEKAHRFATNLHAGQKRLSGEDYIDHPTEVARLLAELHLDVTTITAGLLHDVLEDTRITYEELRGEFGEDVADIVDGVTKIGRLAFQSREEQQAEDLRKMFIAMAKDIRVILVKLCDRLHNMRTLGFCPREVQKQKARETLDIYAPLANRLGIAKIKWELEDLAFLHLEPEIFTELQRKIAQKRQERETYIAEATDILRKKLAEAGMEASIVGRPKHLWSVYQKMLRQGIDFDQVFDLSGVRILTKNVSDCYTALGVIHTLYMPIPGRFKDYVAIPKPNLYQSIHTSVIGPKGHPLEVQIRTIEMHRIAEEGIAAHWKYKESGRPGAVDAQSQFAGLRQWLRQVMEWQDELTRPHDFLESVKIDLFSDEVYVFTPNGDVKALALGSTPVDFAYAVHTEVGHHCRGAKVNGKMVPLKHTLRNGDIVEVVTAKNQFPSADWLKFVKTSRAKNKIRQFIKQQQRERSIAMGKESLAKELRRERLDILHILRSDEMPRIAAELSHTSVEDLLASVGYGKLKVGIVLSRILEVFKPQPAESGPASVDEAPKTIIQRLGGRPRQVVRVRGMDDILTRVAKCCSPVPGDPIVGIITRGRGVSIHNRRCPNVENIDLLQDRLVDVEWDTESEGGYAVKILIIGVDRAGLFADVTGLISKLKTNIITGHMESNELREARGFFVLQIENLEHLNRVLRALEKVKGVVKVIRAMDR